MQPLKIISSLAVLSLLALSSRALASTQEGLTLVADGNSKAVIVLADPPSEAAIQGAKILGDHLAQISGAKFKLVSEKDLAGAKVEQGRIVAKDSPAESFILVGKGRLASQLGVTGKGLGPGGIDIETTANAVVLLGLDGDTPSDPWGTRYAVTTFLEDYLGVRYLWPGETGKVVPKQATITLPAIHAQKTPLLGQRHYRPLAYNSRAQTGLDHLGFSQEKFAQTLSEQSQTQSESGSWFDWHRMGGTLGLHGADGGIVKNTGERFLKEHPEWFAMQADGSREPAPGEERLRICESNIDLINAISQAKIQEMRADPNQKSVCIIEHDGGKTGYCLCPACKALDPADGRPITMWTYNHKTGKIEHLPYVSLTDRVLWMDNQIADRVTKEFPNVLLYAEAYSVFYAPPIKIQKLHPNIVVRIAGSLNQFDDEFKSNWDAWSRVASKVVYRPNTGGRTDGLPSVHVHNLAQKFAYLAPRGMLGTDIDCCIFNWATQGLDYYAVVRLNWDPNLNMDALVDDYCRSGFGPAAGDVKAYFTRLEQAGAYPAKKVVDPADIYTPGLVAELTEDLEAAKKKAAGSPEILARLAFLREGMDWTDIQGQAYALLKKAKEQEPYDNAQAAAVMTRKVSMMRKLFSEDIKAINVGYVGYSEWAAFAPLGWPGEIGAPGKPKAAKAGAKTNVEADAEGKPVETPAK